MVVIAAGWDSTHSYEITAFHVLRVNCEYILDVYFIDILHLA